MLNINSSSRITNKYSYFLTIFKSYEKSRKITSWHCMHVQKKKLHSIRTSGPWNILFFGTDNFALESLRSLYNE